MLNKPLYELLPYLYLVAGFGLINYIPNWVTSAAGALIFIMGAIVWNMRSEFRRKDRLFNRKKRGQGHFLYNLKPFALFLIGITCIAWNDQKLVQFFSMLLCLTAIWILFLRCNNRHLTTSAIVKVYR